MADSNTDPVALAAARLEAAVERLAGAFAQRKPLPAEAAPQAIPEAVPADMVPRAEVIALAERLEETIAQLRSAIGDAAAEEEEALPDEDELPHEAREG